MQTFRAKKIQQVLVTALEKEPSVVTKDLAVKWEGRLGVLVQLMLTNGTGCFADFVVGSSDVQIINQDRQSEGLRPLTLKQIRYKVQSLKQEFKADTGFFSPVKKKARVDGVDVKKHALAKENSSLPSSKYPRMV
jgi:hypothetical protein